MPKENSVEQQLDEALATLRETLLPLLGSAAAAEASDAVKIPPPDEIDELDKDAMNELAEKLGMAVDGRKTGEVRKLLKTAHAVATDSLDEVEEDDVNSLAEAVSVEPAKKLAATVEKLKDYFSQPAPEAAAEAEAATDDATDGGASASGDELPECVTEAELPEPEEMREHLSAYNEACEKGDELEVPDDDDELAVEYRKLLAKLVDVDGDLAKWGDVYTKDDTTHACGLPTVDFAVKGDDREFTKCAVTGKKFVNSEKGIVPFVEKAAKPMAKKK